MHYSRRVIEDAYCMDVTRSAKKSLVASPNFKARVIMVQYLIYR